MGPVRSLTPKSLRRAAGRQSMAEGVRVLGLSTRTAGHNNNNDNRHEAPCSSCPHRAHGVAAGTGGRVCEPRAATHMTSSVVIEPIVLGIVPLSDSLRRTRDWQAASLRHKLYMPDVWSSTPHVRGANTTARNSSRSHEKNAARGSRPVHRHHAGVLGDDVAPRLQAASLALVAIALASRGERRGHESRLGSLAFGNDRVASCDSPVRPSLRLCWRMAAWLV